MDQIICASLTHTHYWYEVGMLKVPYKMPNVFVIVLFILLYFRTKKISCLCMVLVRTDIRCTGALFILIFLVYCQTNL